MTLKDIPSGKIGLFEVLYHWTSIDDALSILKNKEIYGEDHGKHANFSINRRADIAKSKEVCLKFKFNGQHKMMFGDTFDTKDAPLNSHNTIFHLFSSGDPESIYTDEGFSKLGYWQSNVYPGTSGLEFDGIECWDEEYWKGLLSQTLPSKPSRLAFWSYKENIRSYDRVTDNKARQNKLIQQSKDNVGQTIKT
ncbi:hypothetical protein [Pseudoalteromonas sp. APC 3355]|uniref:hypothetical protein n=1 Tax=Pseudoalteromonas sp. APC 3355 TaxID=3035199 RepID=UPI0025B347B2|nr:hypothetical protein [Pseudoalteromonas sp. APC 3355]MDN3474297.1 hypothetical protein [Pseudoalteromonas sp. APC 3355]